MATEAIENTSEPTQPASRLGRRGVMLIAVVAVAAGIAAGVFGAGPFVLARFFGGTPHTRPALATSTILHSVENLVLNPAGSNGTRFLMVTVTFELRDASTEQLMKDREAEIRDRILGLLGKKPIDELADIHFRDRIKQEVLDSTARMFPAGSVKQVYFPQFVIQ